MAKLIINQKLVNKESVEAVMKVCPFGGLDYSDGILNFNAGCKMCKLCVKKGPTGLVSLEEENDIQQIDKSLWNGVSVFIEATNEEVHPVSYELIGKAKELSSVTKHEVYAVLIGSKTKIDMFANQILKYGVDKLFVYEADEFNVFNIERYAIAMEDFIAKIKPSVVLYGGTSLGRSLAPRIAAHFRTGLTADCTMLGMKENTDLIQVRPAFGGNVMAQIVCPNNRPQMATVRYKIFKMPEMTIPHGKIVRMSTTDLDFTTNIKLIKQVIKEKTLDISEAEVIVAVGRPFASAEGIKLAESLALKLGGVVAVTRPLIEAGLKDIKYQIGLSGKTVAPKLIIVLGVSGAVQFTAGMNSSELIIAINKDPHAAIFDTAHYGIVGDAFQIVPKIIKEIDERNI